MFIAIITGMELTRTATRLIYEGQNREERIKEIYGSFIVVIFSSNVLIGGLLLLVGPYVLKPFLNDIAFSPYMVLTIFTLPFIATYSLFKNYLQATNQGMRFIKIDLVYFALNVGFNLYFVIEFKMGAAGIILSTVVSSILLSIYAYFSFFRKTYLRIDTKILKEGLIFSSPIMLYILLGCITENADKWILNGIMGKDISGILYISTMMAAMFNIFRESSNQALNPWFFELYQKRDNVYINKVIYTVFAGMAIVAVGISWFSYEILVVLSSNKDLIAGYKYTPVITNTALVVFLSQIYNMPVFYYKNQSRFLFTSTIASSIVTLILSFILIPLLGPMGAALSNFSAMSVLTFVCGLLAYRSGFRIQHTYFLGVIFISACLSGCALLPLPHLPLLAFKILTMGAILFIYYLYLNRHYNVKALIMQKLYSLSFFRKAAE
jgi:O-antigen/teichoic acid export membrane protein